MHFSRREILKGMGAAGITPLLISACSSSEAGTMLPPLPEDLPEYQWDGPIGPEKLFEHGVASGDPLPEGVILWTRVTAEASEPVEVWWEMALDEDFLERTAQGTLTTDASRDYTVKVDVPGLIWGRNYFYRFALQGRWSPTGRTRLAPKGNEANKLRFGVCSCANYGFGYFHAFRRIAERADLDAVLHLGDYFYEYGNGNYPDDTPEQPQLRMLEPPHETVTLEDYRLRFSLYRRDPDLQECHRQHPFVVVWDDHETANNSWMGGAQNHDPETEGPWSERVAAARQAFFEWIPIRDNQGQELYRKLEYGELADIVMLDTRIEGREQQFSLLVFPADEPSLPSNIISSGQEAWLQSQLSGSQAKWRILGNQVVMSLWQFANPDGSKTNANADQWNGYREGRERLLSYFRDNDIPNTVVVTGDVHSSWAMDVTFGDGSYDQMTEMVRCASNSSRPASPHRPRFRRWSSIVHAQSPHIRYAENERHGLPRPRPPGRQSPGRLVSARWDRRRRGAETLDVSWAVMDGDGRQSSLRNEQPRRPTTDAPDLAPA